MLVCACGVATGHSSPGRMLQVQPLLQALGRGVIDVGGQPQHGSVAKLVGNFFISSLIEVFAEGMALGEKNGVAPSSIAEIVHQLFPGKIAPGVLAQPQPWLAPDRFEHMHATTHRHTHTHTWHTHTCRQTCTHIIAHLMTFPLLW